MHSLSHTHIHLGDSLQGEHRKLGHYCRLRLIQHPRSLPHSRWPSNERKPRADLSPERCPVQPGNGGAKLPTHSLSYRGGEQKKSKHVK